MSAFLPLVVLLVACGSRGGRDVPLDAIRNGAFEVVLPLAGTLVSQDSLPVIVPDVGGGTRVVRLLPSGTAVEAGDVVAELDRTALEQRIVDAYARLEVLVKRIPIEEAQLDSRLRDLENGVARCELALKRAEMRITDSETIPRVEREAARLDAEEAGLALERARTALEAARLKGAADIDLMRLDVRQTRANKTRYEEQLAASTVTAPAPGVVVLVEDFSGRPVAAGDTVYPGFEIARIARPGALRVEAWVPEADAGRIRVGQTVTVRVEGHPESPAPGTVSHTGDMAVRRSAVVPGKYLGVTVDLGQQAPHMRPGMTVQVDVLVDRSEEALTVPREAVFYEGDRPFVWRRHFGSFDAVPVDLGLASDARVVVTGPLSAGDLVALADPGQEPSLPELPAAGTDP
ncbi:MAG: HlyD family efflux transporter periplasmic adaptor subunit [Deltaproteobacteria bacterium]|nr:HlyD family efflux transporter periplasmic adaptor subunit [Deltaproteobacteria bacterium]